MNGTMRNYLGDKVEFVGIDVFAPETDKSGCITWTGYIHNYRERPDNSVSLCTYFDTREHDIHWKKSVKRLIELLKVGGLLVIQMPIQRPEHGPNNPNEPYGELLPGGGRYYRSITLEDVKNMEEYISGFPMKLEEKIVKYVAEGGKGKPQTAFLLWTKEKET